MGFAFSANTGKLLENLVFLALRRKTREIYYYMSPTGYEVDFYLPETRQLIQVAQNLENLATRTRETQAMAEAMQTLNLSRSCVSQ